MLLPTFPAFAIGETQALNESPPVGDPLRNRGHLFVRVKIHLSPRRSNSYLPCGRLRGNPSAWLSASRVLAPPSVVRPLSVQPTRDNPLSPAEDELEARRRGRQAALLDGEAVPPRCTIRRKHSLVAVCSGQGLGIIFPWPPKSEAEGARRFSGSKIFPLAVLVSIFWWEWRRLIVPIWDAGTA